MGKKNLPSWRKQHFIFPVPVQGLVFLYNVLILRIQDIVLKQWFPNTKCCILKSFLGTKQSRGKKKKSTKKPQSCHFFVSTNLEMSFLKLSSKLK